MNARSIKRRIEVQRRKSERIAVYNAYRANKIERGEDYDSYAAFTFKPEEPVVVPDEDAASHS